MLRKLFMSRASAARALPAIPPGERVYAIGDIHGSDALVERLLARIDADDRVRAPAETTLIFLGDLIDRGPAAAAGVARLRALAEARPRVRFLMGNHEEIFLSAVEGDPKALRLFCRIGGRDTALSYGVDAAAYDRMDYDELARALAAQVPAADLDFINGFEDMITIGDYVFVHAGVRPGTALADQRSRDLRWIRDPFLSHDRFLGRMIVHGHTISGSIERRPHRIGIDTGAYQTGILTALALEDDAVWEVCTEATDAGDV